MRAVAGCNARCARWIDEETYLFVIGSSTFPTMSGFNPTLTIQALAYMSADAIVNRYKTNPGALL
jgi:choline dehydrogenase-like flavoprotein